jgi:hypothetical protein
MVVQFRSLLQGYGAATVMLPRNLLPSSSGVWRSRYKFSMTGSCMTGRVGRSIRKVWVRCYVALTVERAVMRSVVEVQYASCWQ